MSRGTVEDHHGTREASPVECAGEAAHRGRDLFAPIYGWFTEGLATPDLKEAKVLLDGLE
jgi:hypothetical protein